MARPTPQDLAEQALSRSTADQCIAIVRDATSANLRWANNTLTTNGVGHAVQVTVISFVGRRNASVSGSAATVEQVAELVAAADGQARAAEEAEDVADLVAGTASADWSEDPRATSIEVFGRFAEELGQAFEEAEAGRRILDEAEHDVVEMVDTMDGAARRAAELAAREA